MENLKNFYEKYRVYLTRQRLELLAVVAIVLCALLVFFLNIPGKGVLKLDNGTIVYDGSLVRGKMNGQGTITFQKWRPVYWWFQQWSLQRKRYLSI